MMIRTITITAICALLCSCGVLKKNRTAVPEEPQKQESGERILYPTNHRPVAEDEGLPSPVPDERAKAKSVAERPEIKFSMVESANVRVPGINPLPDGGYLEISLDDLRDEFCYPLKGRFLSPYGMRSGRMHTGADIKGQPGDTIRAALPGVVRMSKLYSSYGNLIVIRHYCGFETLYSHNTKNLVDVNDVVEAGQPIAIVGRTGRATTEHLHFEVRASGDHVDPEKLIDVNEMRLRDSKIYFRIQDGCVVASNDPAEFEKMAEQSRAQKERDAAAVAAAKEKAAKTKADEPKKDTSKAQYHTVKKGDTLYAIALKYSTTVKKLCELNGIKEKSVLQINQKIRVR